MMQLEIHLMRQILMYMLEEVIGILLMMGGYMLI